MIDDTQLVGPQLQLCDARVAGVTQTGGLYGILSPDRDASKPLGNWNTARLVVKGKHREHWINNVKVLEYETDSDVYKSAISSAKVKDWPGLAEHQKGAIALECHRFTDKESAEVAYRNIRIRVLPDTP
jgi:hypothetical protein